MNKLSLHQVKNFIIKWCPDPSVTEEILQYKPTEDEYNLSIESMFKMIQDVYKFGYYKGEEDGYQLRMKVENAIDQHGN